jgi:hypothetical protein
MKRLLKEFYNIKVKKSRYFYIGLIVIFLLFIAAYVHNNNIAYIVMFFIFSFMFVSFFIGFKNIKKVKAEVVFKRVFANQKAYIPIKVKNAKFVKAPRLEVEFKKRGYNVLPEFFVESDYPLFFYKFYKKIFIKDKIIVYPALKGESLKNAFGIKEDIDFEGLKPYDFEEAKYIYWPSLAKGDIQAKKFNSLNEGTLKFYYEKILGDKEYKISQLALWAKEAFERGYEFEIIFPDIKISSKEGFDEVFKKLALY